MKLFRRGESPITKADDEAAAAVPVPPPVLPPLRQISLTSEQRSILEEPVDPRVDRILEEVYVDKIAAEHALNTSGTADSPNSSSSKRQVVQDKEGLWRIVPGQASPEPNSLLDAL